MSSPANGSRAKDGEAPLKENGVPDAGLRSLDHCECRLFFFSHLYGPPSCPLSPVLGGCAHIFPPAPRAFLLVVIQSICLWRCMSRALRTNCSSIDKRALPPWRYDLRQRMLPMVRWETPYLAYLQDKFRTPALDSYFAITANLGTHTFFMIGLPILFWCGYPAFGKG